jgi:hypothetical protein
MSDNLLFNFSVDVNSFKLVVPKTGETAYHIDAFDAQGKSIGVARFVPGVTANFHVLLNHDGGIAVIYQ